ncbi:TetR/AcrR family transcriptional regulator [Bacillus tequilensis]|uniref:TetR/AcrR family transcriptional regulator n=1 Tax=Bacillus tequilensis TaxID=227866 RepID=UPI0015753CC7|nr:TetR/AcrR family transcriptional regulator [Bacillus tequilensis]NTU26275.1 TetR/AcrR family transcriptional regulator [Bacillus tequilensis]
MKKRMLAETIRLIRQKGFSFTMNDLAAALGTSKRTLYAHYSSKDKLAGAVVEQFIAEMKQMERDIYENERLDVLEKVKQLLIGLPQGMDLLNMGLLSELKKYHYDAWLTLDTFMKEEWTIVFELLNECKRKKRIRNINVDLFVHMYIGSINQVYDPEYPLKHQFTTGEVLESIVDVLMNGITADEEDEA